MAFYKNLLTYVNRARYNLQPSKLSWKFSKQILSLAGGLSTYTYIHPKKIQNYMKWSWVFVGVGGGDRKHWDAINKDRPSFIAINVLLFAAITSMCASFSKNDDSFVIFFTAFFFFRGLFQNFRRAFLTTKIRLPTFSFSHAFLPPPPRIQNGGSTCYFRPNALVRKAYMGAFD